MRNVFSGSLVRMALALGAVLLVAGPGLVLAAGPNPTYVPKSSVLIGPTTVAHGGTANYVLRVTFTNSAVLDFPPTMGATFTAVNGTISPTSSSNPVVYVAPATGTKDRITGTFTQNGANVISSLTITLSP